MTKNVCENCGGQIESDGLTSLCPYCGAKITDKLKILKDDEIKRILGRRKNKFILLSGIIITIIIPIFYNVIVTHGYWPPYQIFFCSIVSLIGIIPIIKGLYGLYVK